MIKDILKVEVKKTPEYHSVGMTQEDLVRITTAINNLTQMAPFEIDEDSPFEFLGSVKGKGSSRYQRRQREYVIMNFRIKDIPESSYVLPPEKIEEIQRLWDAIRMAPELKSLPVFLEDRWEVTGYLTKDNRTARRVTFTFSYLPKEGKDFDEFIKQQIVDFEARLAKEDMTPEERKAARVEFARMLNLRGV